MTFCEKHGKANFSRLLLSEAVLKCYLDIVNTMEFGEGLYQCDQCGHYCNSQGNLDLHHTFYCQEKAIGHMVSSDTEDVTNRGKSDTKPTLSSPGSSENDGNTSSTPKEPPSSKLHDVQSPEYLIKRQQSTSFSNVQTSSRTGSMYPYPHSNYSSDKSASPIRHVRMHRSLNRAAEATALATAPSDRYCATCDIMFTLIESNKVHKETYCNKRQVQKITSLSSPNTSQHQTTQQQTLHQLLSPRDQPPNRDPSAKAGYNMDLNQPLYSAIYTSPLIPDPCSYLAGAGNLSPRLVPAGNIVIPNTQASYPDPEKNVIPTFTVMPGSEANEVQPSEESSRTKLSESKRMAVHKELYCNTPHDHKSTSSSSPSTNQHQTTQQQTLCQLLSSRNQPSPRDPSANAGHIVVLNQPLYSAIYTSPLIPEPCSYLAGAGNLSPSLVPAGNIVIPNTQASFPDPQKNVIPTFTVMPWTEANEVQPQQQTLYQLLLSRDQPLPRDPSANAGHIVVLNQPLYSAVFTSPLILEPCSYLAGAGNLSPSLVPAGNNVIPNTKASSPDPQKNVIPTFTVMPWAEDNEVQPSEESLRTKLSEAKDTSASKEDRLKIPMQKDKYQDGGKDEGVPLELV